MLSTVDDMVMTKDTRKSKKYDNRNVPLAARVDLELGASTGRYEFEHIAVNTDDAAFVTVVLSSDDGRRISVMLPRAQVRKLLTWRLILSL